MVAVSELKSGNVRNDTAYYSFTTLAGVSTKNGNPWNGTSDTGKYLFDATSRANYDAAGSVGFSSWGKVANIQYAPASGSNTNVALFYADFKNVTSTPKETVAYSGWTNYNYNTTTHFISKADIALEKTLLLSTDTGLQNLIHEVGHSYGLQHPGSVGNNPDWNQGMSIMSYNALKFASVAIPVISPMIYDIAAVQQMYGASSYNSGNTTYSVGAITGQAHASTLWDAGGTDTIDLSQGSLNTLTKVVLDLRGGLDETGAVRWSTIGSEKIAIAWEASQTATNPLDYKAVQIEIAKGTQNGDVIQGGTAANTLYGNAGSDILYGNGGNDTLYGGTSPASSGYDQMFGGLGDDSMIGTNGGVSYYYAHEGHDVIRMGGGTGASRQDVIYAANRLGAGTQQVDIYVTGKTAGGADSPGHVNIWGYAVANDTLPSGASEYGTNIIVHGTANDTVDATLGSMADIFTFEGHFANDGGSVALGGGATSQDKILFALQNVNGIQIFGDSSTTGLDDSDKLIIGGVDQSTLGARTLLQYVDAKGTSSLVWDGGADASGAHYGIVLKAGYFEWLKLDASHFSTSTSGGVPYYLPIATSNYSALVRTTVDNTPDPGQVTDLPFGMTLAAYQDNVDVHGITLS